LKAITLWQPWASLMAFGDKKIETRSWHTRYRGPLAIHAAKKIVPYTNIEILSAIESHGLNCRKLPTGAVLAICELVDCKKIGIHNRPDMPERAYGDYAPGRYMWITKELTALSEPITARGYQGVWNWDIEWQLFQGFLKGNA